ncbi:hypothetical protein ANN_16184 [Periplaneta americana]|uniref:Uncharacterized protein n=2 Tax=Periplaneta americana TaxID=6978 RepID=A0ABQ8SIC3_PERAM|nr:hypothetical protein ANN_16184 [Periplaneta americana]
MRIGRGDMDLRNNPGMLPQVAPSQLMGGQFDSDFRQQNSGIGPLLPRPNQGSPHHGGMRGDSMHESLREPYDEEKDMRIGDPGSGVNEGRYLMGGPQYTGHPPRGLLEQEGWGSGPRKRRWGDPLLDEEDSSHGDHFGNRESGLGGNYRQGGNYPGGESYGSGYPRSPGEEGNSPSNGRSFGNDREDSPSRNYGRERNSRGAPGSWGGGSYPSSGQGSPYHHQMEGGFRSRGGRGGYSGRGRGGGPSRGGSRGRFGGPRGMRSGRGPKRGQF